MKEIKVKDLNYKYNDKGYVFNHSLMAYSKETIENNLTSLLNDNNVQICCTLKGQYINGIGVELKGECLLVGTRDMCSEIDKDGDRTISDDMVEYVYNGNLEDATLMEVVDNYYNEAIVTNFSVIGMWCNPYCAKSNVEAKEILVKAKQLANKHNLKLKIVQNNSLFY